MGLSYERILKGTGVNLENFERNLRRHKNVVSWACLTFIFSPKRYQF